MGNLIHKLAAVPRDQKTLQLLLALAQQAHQDSAQNHQRSPLVQVILQVAAQCGLRLVGLQSFHVDFLAQYSLPCLFSQFSSLI